LETDLDAVQTRMSDPDFYKGDAAQISAAQTQQSELEQQLAEAFARWDELDQFG
jgi:ATP-binding cassette subfamily F protein uup